MPTRAQRSCSVPGCANFLPCPEHSFRAVFDRQRGTRQARGYDADWLRCRAYILSREPLCRRCKREQATAVDHILPLRRGGARLDPDNLQPLCASCHNKKTATEDSQRPQRRPHMFNQKPPVPPIPKPQPKPEPEPEPDEESDE